MARDESAIEAVVVLARNDAVLSSREILHPGAWVVRAEGGTSIDLTAVLLGWGHRNASNGESSISVEAATSR